MPKSGNRALAENIAEICFAAGGIVDRKHRHWEERDSRDLMDALIAAAEALTDYETKHGRDKLWINHDWMLTCDELADAVVIRGESGIRASEIPAYLQDY